MISIKLGDHLRKRRYELRIMREHIRVKGNRLGRNYLNLNLIKNINSNDFLARPDPPTGLQEEVDDLKVVYNDRLKRYVQNVKLIRSKPPMKVCYYLFVL